MLGGDFVDEVLVGGVSYSKVDVCVRLWLV